MNAEILQGAVSQLNKRHSGGASTLILVPFFSKRIKQTPPRKKKTKKQTKKPYGSIFENRSYEIYGNLICLPVLTCWIACACVAVCSGAAGELQSWWTLWSWSWSPGCGEPERSFLLEENVLLCKLIPAALWCPCVLSASGQRDKACTSVVGVE